MYYRKENRGNALFQAAKELRSSVWQAFREAYWKVTTREAEFCERLSKIDWQITANAIRDELHEGRDANTVYLYTFFKNTKELADSLNMRQLAYDTSEKGRYWFLGAVTLGDEIDGKVDLSTEVCQACETFLTDLKKLQPEHANHLQLA